MVSPVLALDCPRPLLIERPLAFHRYAKEISLGTGGKNAVFYWPGAEVFTLQPINFTTAFTETDFYDDLKLALPNWNRPDPAWVQSYEGHNASGGNGGKFDPFLNLTIPAPQLPTGYPDNMTAALLSNLFTSKAGDPVLPPQNLANNATVQILNSLQIFPANQGFMLRFYVEGRGSFTRGSLLRFSFGEYIVSLDTNGMAQLYQSADYLNYALVYSFRWCDQAEVHDAHHRLTIFPHARNKIEFLAGNEYVASFDLTQPKGIAWRSLGGVYTVPGELIYDANSDQFTITQQAPCSLFACSEFRPYVQVSKLAFVNGSLSANTPGSAYVYDSSINLEFPALAQFTGQMQFDSNGCNIAGAIYDPKTQTTWQPGQGSQAFVFACEFFGAGDNEDGSSSVTPELYGYGVGKGPLFQDPANVQVLTPFTSVEMASGESAEAEHMSVNVDNSDGQVDRFTRRGHIDVAIGYADAKGNSHYLFEGEAIVNQPNESIQHTRSVTLECKGMARQLTRAHWNLNAPNFGHDLRDPKGQGCFWSESVFYAFEVAGIPRSNVVIEDVENYDFRLWDEAQGGGTAQPNGILATLGQIAKNVVGDAHVNKKQQPRWQPKFDSTPYDWLELLLHGYLGWHFAYSPTTRDWRVWKRPVPNNTRDLQNLVPKAVFVGSVAAQQAAIPQTNLPIYLHQQRKEKIKAAEYAGVVVSAKMMESGLPSKAKLQEALTVEQTSGGTAADSAFTTTERAVQYSYLNPNGYPTEVNNFAPDRNHPDYIGRQTFRDLFTTAPSREALNFIALRAYWHWCFGQTYTNLTAAWGDVVTASFRKWDLVYIDSGKDKDGHPNGSFELWYVDMLQPAWKSSLNIEAQYNFSLYRPDCPPPM